MDLGFRGEYGKRSHLDSDFFSSMFVRDLEIWGLRSFFFKYFKVSRGALTDCDFFWSRFVWDLESWGLRSFFFKYFKLSRGALTDSFGFLPPSLDATPVFFLSFNMNIF